MATPTSHITMQSPARRHASLRTPREERLVMKQKRCGITVGWWAEPPILQCTTVSETKHTAARQSYAQHWVKSTNHTTHSSCHVTATSSGSVGRRKPRV